VNGITRVQEGIVRGETIAMFTLKSELVAIGIAKMTSKEMHDMKQGVAARTDRVMMDIGVYPSWKQA
ncbi:RNA-guided pseudouridylation complex pseudouridine synthase subunit Cbf5, partial [archaeon]